MQFFTQKKVRNFTYWVLKQKLKLNFVSILGFVILEITSVEKINPGKVVFEKKWAFRKQHETLYISLISEIVLIIL